MYEKHNDITPDVAWYTLAGYCNMCEGSGLMTNRWGTYIPQYS